MRVIAGKYRSRKLVAPTGTATRPTSDRVREAMFSILGAQAIVGARVLDLYAGTGGLGIEAMSRGAESVDFVDSSAAAVRAIRKNIGALGLQADVHQLDCLRFLRSCVESGRCFDLILIDPPYRLATEVGPALTSVVSDVLSSSATIVVESDRRLPIAIDLPLSKERHYGDTLLSFYTDTDE